MRDCLSNTNYKGKDLPNCNCSRCWQTYFEAHTDDPITGKVMAAFMGRIAWAKHEATDLAMDDLVNRITHECE